VNILLAILALIFSFLLLGCDKDESLNCFPDGEMVSVIAKMPLDSEILPLEVIYRSNYCLKSRKNPNGDEVKEPAYHFVKKEFSHTASDSVFNLTIARNGGGQCKWMLSNITLGFNIKEVPLAKSENAERIPIKEIVVFDDNSPQRLSGSSEAVNGNVKLEGDYFPLITKRRDRNSPLEYSIVRSSPDVIYKSISAKEVIFSPRLHSTKILRATESQVQKVGEYISVLYPDNTTESSPYFPNYKKLQAILKDNN